MKGLKNKRTFALRAVADAVLRLAGAKETEQTKAWRESFEKCVEKLSTKDLESLEYLIEYLCGSKP